MATSSAVELRPYCGAIHSYPSACRGTISLLKHEPSAQSPWQNTMLGFVCVILLSLLACHTFRLRQNRTLQQNFIEKLDAVASAGCRGTAGSFFWSAAALLPLSPH